MSGAVRVDYAVVFIWLVICSLYTTLLTITALAVVFVFRKRRSSILKSQRPPRAPFSELEFNVATPTDTAKSRRVSFSRRTGVAEFVRNEATTTWKNVYEEHNKSLESSGNDSEINPPRPSVGHLGKRIFDQQFQEVDACDLLTLDEGGRTTLNNDLFQQFENLENLESTDSRISAPQRKFELSSVTTNQSKMFADEMTAAGLGEISDHISVTFSNLQPVGGQDDLEDIEQDLKRQAAAPQFTAFKGADVSEYIEIDLNTTTIGARHDESDMSITDTIHSPKVNVSKSISESLSAPSVDKKDSTDWVVNKENIAINPYVTPKESNNFAINEYTDKVLVYDGKRLTMQTEPKEKVSRTSTVQSSERISQIKPIVLNVDDDLPNFVEDPRASVSHIVTNFSMDKTVLDGEELSMTAPLQTELNRINSTVKDDFAIAEVATERRKTIIYDSNIEDISVTQAVPSNIMLLENVPCSSDKLDDLDQMKQRISQSFSTNKIEGRNHRNETVVDDENNISITQAVSSNMILMRANNTMNEKRKTIVFESDNGNMSMTGVIPENVIMSNTDISDKRKTIVFEDNDISMTRVVSGNIITENPGLSQKRKTIIFEDDNNISMTQAVSSNILMPIIQTSKMSEETKTIFESNMDGKTILESNDISMTEVVSQDVIVPINQKRKTIVFDSDDADISMTQAIPSNIIIPEAEQQDNGLEKSEKRKTIVFDSADISMTCALPMNIILTLNKEPYPEIEQKPSAIDNMECQDISMTEAPDNMKFDDKNNIDETAFGDMSVTQAVPVEIIEPTREASNKSALNIVESESISLPIPLPMVDSDSTDLVSKENVPKRRQTIIEDSDMDDISDTQTLPTNLQLPEKLIAKKDSTVSLSSASKETVKKRESQEINGTELNQEKLEEPQVTIHTHSNLNKIFRAEKVANLSVTKPIPADLLAIQRILEKSNVNQLFNIGKEKDPVNQNVIVYQASTNKGVIPSVDTDIDSITKESVPSATNDLSKTDLQPNRGQIELFRTQNNRSPSPKDIAYPFPKSNFLSKTPSDKSRMSHIISPTTDSSKKSEESIALAVVSTTASQHGKSTTEGANSPLKPYKILEDGTNSPSEQSKLLIDSSSQQSKNSVLKAESKKSLLVDLLDMSYASITSGWEDKSATALIESVTSVKEATKAPEKIDEEKEKSKESLFFITSGSECEKSEEDKQIEPKEIALQPNEKEEKETSDVPNSKTSMMRYLQQKLAKFKDKMPSNRFFEKVVSPDKESHMTEQLLEMLDSFTDVEEQTNPLEEINTEDQNKFLAIASRNRQSSGHSRKGSIRTSPVSRSSTSHGSPGHGSSPVQTRRSLPVSEQSSPSKRGSKKESPVSSRKSSAHHRGPSSPRKSPNKLRESTSPRKLSYSGPPSPRIGADKKTFKNEKKKDAHSPTSKNVRNNTRNELLNDLIDKDNSEHMSRENSTEEGMIYLINDVDDASKTSKDDVLRTVEAVQNTEAQESDELLELKQEVMEHVLKDTVNDDHKENINIAENETPVQTDVDEINEEINEIKILDDNDLSCVLKEAMIVKKLLYPMEDDDMEEEKEEVDGKKALKGKGLLSIEDKSKQESTDTQCEPQKTVSVACSLEDLSSRRRSLINPRRQSVVISKEDLMSNISLAQAILQKELEESPADLESPPTNVKEKRMRISNEVVKSLRFEDDDYASESDLGSSIIKSDTSPLRKTVFGETSYMSDLKNDKVNVIPSYLKDVTDGLKELMNDLMKPDADADVLPFAETKIKKKEDKKVTSTRNTQAQVDLFESSQVDILKDQGSTTESLQSLSVTKKNQARKACGPSASNKSVTVKFDESPTKEVPKVIVFDPSNPLNNIFIKPADFSQAHRYEPMSSNETLEHKSQGSDESVEKMSTQYNVRTIGPTYENQNISCHRIEVEDITDITTRNDEYPTPKFSDCNTLQKIPEVDSLEMKLNSNSSVDKAVSCDSSNRDVEVNTVIAMRDNVQILECDSSLTLVDEAGDNEAKIDPPTSDKPHVSKVEIIYDPHNKNFGKATQNIDLNDSKNSKRKYSPSVPDKHKYCTLSVLDVTPKPAKKIPKRSISPVEVLKYSVKEEFWNTSPNRSKKSNRSSIHSSPSKRSELSNSTKNTNDGTKSQRPKTATKSPKDVKSPPNRPRTANSPKNRKDSPQKQKITTVQQLIIVRPLDKSKQIEGMDEGDVSDSKKDFDTKMSTTSSKSELTRTTSFATSCGKTVMDWQPELINELSSKNLVIECESDVNVLKLIDDLPFMGSPECSWERGNCQEWSFRFLHGRLRLRIQLDPNRRDCTDSGACIRSDTPITELRVDNLHQGKRNSVAVVCVQFAAEAMRYLSGRAGVYTRAGDVPALLRRCAGVARVALKWGRAMHEAWSHLAYSITDSGLLTLKVANVPLRSVWEVTMQLELVIEDAREVPWPKASDVRVVCVLSDHIVTRDEVHRLLHNVRKDWGHVPRTVWKIFRYLKYKTRDSDPLLAM